jgi:hypothetical protein
MKTNDIKKGYRVKLDNGWMGTMMDNARGNTRMVEVEGFYTETGSVYAHDIKWAKAPSDNGFTKVEHTDKQLALKTQLNSIFA